MTNTYFIRVVVDPSGAVRGINRIAQALDHIEGKAGRVGSALRTMLAIDLARRAVGGIIRLGDAYTDLENKVRNASGKNDLLTVSMDKVFRAANRARTDVGAFGKTVLAISGATANMNLGFDASVRMAETLAKMMKLGGASMQEAKSATIQYGQALRKGKLNGDEMRSVMENSIELQRALAKSMGVSTDELLKQSKAGKITRAVMVDALVKTADEVDRKFAQMSMKVSDAWTVIENSATRFAGSLKINETLAPILLFIADNFDTIAKAALVAANVLGTYFVRKGIQMAIAGLVKLGAAAVANPFTAIIFGITAVIAYLRIFAKDMQVVAGSTATWGDLFASTWEEIKIIASEIGEGIKMLISDITGFFGEMVDAADISGKDILMFFVISVDSIIKLFEALKDTIINIFGGIPVIIADYFIQGVNVMIDALNDLDIRLQKLKDFATGNWKGKYETRSTGNVVPPQSDYGYSWLAPDRVGKGAPGSEYVQTNRSPREEARSRGFADDTYDLARKMQITLNEAASRQAMGTGLGTPEYEGHFARVKNPFEGSVAAFEKRVQETSDKLFSGEAGPLQKMVERIWERANDPAFRLARKTVDSRTGIGEFGGKPGDPEVDEKAKKARERALKDWEQLQASVNGVYKAELELANAQETIDKARSHGIEITAEQEAMVLMRKRDLLQDQLDPYRAITREIQEQIDQTRTLANEGDIHKAVVEETNKLWDKGVALTGAQINNLEKMRLLQKGLSDDQKRKNDMLAQSGFVSGEELKARALAQAQLAGVGEDELNRIAESKFMGRLVSETDRYSADLQRIIQIGKELTASGVEQNQVFMTQAALLANLNKEYGYLANTQQSVTRGLKEGWVKTFEEFGNTAAQVSSYVQDVFKTMSTAIVDAIMQVDIKWGDLFLSLMRGLAELATQRLLWELMKLAMPGTPGVGQGVQAVGALVNPPGAATGGVFKVSGPPGRDNVFAPMWLSNGEHVAVWPAGQQPESDEAPSAPVSGGTNVIVVRNEREAALAVMQSPAGRRTQIKNLTYSEAYLRTLQAKS